MRLAAKKAVSNKVAREYVTKLGLAESFNDAQHHNENLNFGFSDHSAQDDESEMVIEDTAEKKFFAIRDRLDKTPVSKFLEFFTKFSGLSTANKNKMRILVERMKI